ncbi:MAG: pyruvate:ferredoxin (flavodoxin) oxidoreductase [Clostridiales bacterium]|jgi:pyruvate-ferredoxin/flavodoxin oxidoreductase|nr:pyruvate:ferredoxin (flavodoxin) oxidoreductase [Clostridiales bacterium]
MKKMSIDGGTAASHVAYAFSEVASIYPISPSSSMAEIADEWAASGRKNIFGQVLRMAEMQSEGGAAGSVHGSLVAGALSTTYTASQGLLLMIPNMYRIAGELLPTVFHVSARALAYHALSIFNDHSDVMAIRQTGFAMLASSSVQDAMDMAAIAHLSTLKASVPFVHFFDGYRTSHEISKIDVFDYEELASFIDDDLKQCIKDFRARALNPEHPAQKGTAQNPDIYFQAREASSKYHLAIPKIVKTMMDKVSKVTGRKYKLFEYYGAKDADSIIVSMGSSTEVVEEAIDYLNAKGNKFGAVKIRLFRPFSIADFVSVIPKTVKRIAVLDRTKESGSVGEPLYLDVVSALKESGKTDITVVGGRYGLGAKEFNPTCVSAIFKNLTSKSPKNHFTVGIHDDVCNTSLDIDEIVYTNPKGSTQCKFYGLGSDGTVGANKNSIKIIGDNTPLYVQGHFVYDSKKSGGLTVSHLRFGSKHIKSSYLVESADFVACHTQSYVLTYDMLHDLKEGGVFLLNTLWSESELETQLPAHFKQEIAKKKVKFYIIDAITIAKNCGMGRHTNGVLQAAFFKIANIIPFEKAIIFMKDAIAKTYKKKGEAVIQKNNQAIDSAIAGLTQVKYDAVAWAKATTGADTISETGDEYYDSFIQTINKLKGDSLPVSAFNADGSFVSGTTKYEKRGISDMIAEWIPEECIQCNQCALVCPHSCIRPVLLNQEQADAAPSGYTVLDAMGFKNDAQKFKYRIEISPKDCTGCGSCVNVCPAKNKALKMSPQASIPTTNQEYTDTIPFVDVAEKFKPDTIKGSQFKQSLFEYSGACAGCGETPYIKLVTQLFGDRMIIANATGCTSIYGGSAPSNPYTHNAERVGPAWANSLFEDNAEFGYGINLAYTARRDKIQLQMQKAMEIGASEVVRDLFERWIKSKSNADVTKQLTPEIKVTLNSELKKVSGELNSIYSEILENSDCLVKKSIWIIGGDGWAYDIGFGGLDHCIAQGEDINILVLDTESYSNTGGQASKSTPTGSIAKFAANGKRTKKKDLGLMAMSYGHVYVAQIGMGANMNQTIKAMAEAESYNGPSVIIAYSTCIAHGIDMSNGQLATKRAVESGYWHLYRYNPSLALEGKNPFILDSKDPVIDYQSFLENETRYVALKKSNPEIAQELFSQAAKDSADRLALYKRMAGQIS